MVKNNWTHTSTTRKSLGKWVGIAFGRLSLKCKSINLDVLFLLLATDVSVFSSPTDMYSLYGMMMVILKLFLWMRVVVLSNVDFSDSVADH